MNFCRTKVHSKRQTRMQGTFCQLMSEFKNVKVRQLRIRYNVFLMDRRSGQAPFLTPEDNQTLAQPQNRVGAQPSARQRAQLRPQRLRLQPKPQRLRLRPRPQRLQLQPRPQRLRLLPRPQRLRLRPRPQRLWLQPYRTILILIFLALMPVIPLCSPMQN